MTNNENCGDRPIYFKNLSGHETGKFYSMARRTDKRVEKYEKKPCVGSYDLARVRPEAESKNKRLDQGGGWGKAKRFKEVKKDSVASGPGPGHYGIHTKSTLGTRTIKFATAGRPQKKYDTSIPASNAYDIRNMNACGEPTFTAKTIKFSLTGHDDLEHKMRLQRSGEPGPGMYGPCAPTDAESQWKRFATPVFPKSGRPSPDKIYNVGKPVDQFYELGTTLVTDSGRSFPITTHMTGIKSPRTAGGDVPYASQLSSFGGGPN